MEIVTIKSKTESGIPLEASYAPGKGMNMVSFKKGDIEVIDQSTKPDFESRFAGLGAFIGPHFFRRNPQTIAPIADESLFPHIAAAREHGDPDPFTHGIGRYAPWNYTAGERKISATLSGKDTWHDIPLSELEGQNFRMNFNAEIDEKGLHLSLSVVSDTASLVGIHYYYHLPQKKGTVTAGVQDTYYDPHVKRPIPDEWNYDANQTLTYELDRATDYAFHPYPNPRHGNILLDAVDYRLRTTYTTASSENAFQVYHPEGASFVCIEPCSAQDPRHANLTVSSIHINLEILD